MAAEIKPGQWLSVKVTAEPKASAARKTMIRLLEEDEGVVAERKRLARARQVKTHIRGGRPWAVRPSRVQVVKTTPGAQYKVFGSVAMLRQLESISRYIEVTPA